MIRMFFFDIDGTLVDPKIGEFSEPVCRAINWLHEQNIIPVLVSGRPAFAITPLAELLSIDTYIAYNGGLAVVSGETVYDNPMDRDQLEQLISIAASNKHPLIFPGRDGYYATMVEHPDVHKIFNESASGTPILNPDYWRANPIYQVELIAPDTEMSVYLEHFSTEFHFYPWHVTASATNVNPSANSKAVAMHHVLKRFNLDESVAAAIGDGPNDIEMIQAAQIGIAMGNACEELKLAADYVTDEVSADGAAKAIYRFLA
jgi:Cof subfamily protein (haloacid dehalogenase superfamily)